jgi:hypothetical protein
MTELERLGKEISDLKITNQSLDEFYLSIFSMKDPANRAAAITAHEYGLSKLERRIKILNLELTFYQIKQPKKFWQFWK